MHRVPCPSCHQPLEEFRSHTEASDGQSERILVYVHQDQTCCQIRVPVLQALAGGLGQA